MGISEINFHVVMNINFSFYILFFQIHSVKMIGISIFKIEKQNRCQNILLLHKNVTYAAAQCTSTQAVRYLSRNRLSWMWKYSHKTLLKLLPDKEVPWAAAGGRGAAPL